MTVASNLSKHETKLEMNFHMWQIMLQKLELDEEHCELLVSAAD
jgi:hypothetical protein